MGAQTYSKTLYAKFDVLSALSLWPRLRDSMDVAIVVDSHVVLRCALSFDVPYH